MYFVDWLYFKVYEVWEKDWYVKMLEHHKSFIVSLHLL